MNKEKILQEILNDPVLKEKYWSNISTEKFNVNTLLKENNKYLTSLFYLFEESNQVKFTGMINNIKKTFEL